MLAPALLPGGRREGAIWRSGSIAGEAGQSLALHLGGARRGRWRDFATGEHGDCLDLVRVALGADTAGAMTWARAWLGGTLTVERAPVDATTAPSSERNRDAALTLWRQAAPAIGSPVDRYLAGRGLMLPPPPSLRFHAECWHGPSGRRWPTMIAAVQAIDGRVVAVHRTALLVYARGVVKAPVDRPKAMLGPTHGGAVRFAAAGDELHVAEGVESALSAMQATGAPTWAALSTSGLRALVLPDHVRRVVILADHDEPGIAAAHAAAARWSRERRSVRVAVPPRPGADFNDMLASAA